MKNLNKVKDNYYKIKEDIERIVGINNSVKIIPVTKSVGFSEINNLIELGFTTFAENRIEQLSERFEYYRNQSIHFDFIGNIQSRKISKIIEHSRIIHSVDSKETVQKINSLSQKLNLITKILLQVNISGEIQKNGFRPDELLNIFDSFIQLQNIQILGLMTMAPHTADTNSITNTFRGLRKLRDKLKPIAGEHFNELSMGMSEDYKIALTEGATTLRIGSLFFREGEI